MSTQSRTTYFYSEQKALPARKPCLPFGMIHSAVKKMEGGAEFLDRVWDLHKSGGIPIFELQTRVRAYYKKMKRSADAKPKNKRTAD